MTPDQITGVKFHAGQLSTAATALDVLESFNGDATAASKRVHYLRQIKRELQGLAAECGYTLTPICMPRQDDEDEGSD